MAAVDANLAAGKAATIDFDGHAVLVAGKTSDTPPMYIIDSWSRQYELTQAQLEKVIEAARGHN